MISKHELKDRMQRATDESFSSPSSTLMERLPDLVKAGASTALPVHVRAGRRFAVVLGSVGVIGWLTMASAGALVGISAVGKLPDPIQQFVADVVGTVGIDLPDPAQARTDNERRQSDSTGSTTTSSVGGTTTPSSPNGNTTSPGQSGNAPGQGGTAPGQSGNAPGQGGTAPGQGGTSPGQSGDAPGQGGTSPGQSGDAPGQGGTSPGQSGDAPGRGGTAPGQSGR